MSLDPSVCLASFLLSTLCQDYNFVFKRISQETNKSLYKNKNSDVF